MGDMGSTFNGLSGKTKDDFGHGEAKFITYMNVFSNPIADLTMTESIEIDKKQKSVKAGDVFFTTSSETPDEVGMSSVMPEDADNIYLNSFCFGYRPTEKFDLNYLAYVLRADSFRKEMTFLAQGISRYNISKNKVMEVCIPVPTIEEQTKVGRYFRNLDHLITLHQCKCQIDGCRFQSPLAITWEQRKLSDIAVLTSSKRVHAEDYVETGVPFYRGKEISELKEHKPISEVLYITEYKYNEISSMYGSPKEGDLLITAVGTLGNTWVIDQTPFYFKDGNLIWFKDIKCNPKYLDYAMSTADGQKKILASAIGSNQKALTMVKLNELEFMFPGKAEQDKIAEYFSYLDNLITLHQCE